MAIAPRRNIAALLALALSARALYIRAPSAPLSGAARTPRGRARAAQPFPDGDDEAERPDAPSSPDSVHISTARDEPLTELPASIFLEEYGVITVLVFAASFFLLSLSAPGLIDSSVTVVAFPLVVLLANNAGPLLERVLISRRIASAPLSVEVKALVTTTSTVLSLKLLSALF